MKFCLLLFYLLCFFIQTSSAKDNDFYDAVIMMPPYGLKSFLAFDIDSNEYKGRIIIENVSFYLFLSETRDFDEKAYAAFTKDLLINKKVLRINDGDLDLKSNKISDDKFLNVGFIKIMEDKDVNTFASKGKKKFLAHYFEERIINDEAVKEYDTMYAVANKLFEWQTLTYIDDLSGRLAFWDYKKIRVMTYPIE